MKKTIIYFIIILCALKVNGQEHLIGLNFNYGIVGGGYRGHANFTDRMIKLDYHFMNYEKKMDVNVAIGLRNMVGGYSSSSANNYFSAGIGYNFVFLKGKQFPFIGVGINMNKLLNQSSFNSSYTDIYYNGLFNAGVGGKVSDHFAIKISIQYEFGLTTFYSNNKYYPGTSGGGHSAETFRNHEFSLLFGLGYIF